MMGMNGSSEIAERVAMMEFGREDKTVLTPGCRIPIGCGWSLDLRRGLDDSGLSSQT